MTDGWQAPPAPGGHQQQGPPIPQGPPPQPGPPPPQFVQPQGPTPPTAPVAPAKSKTPLVIGGIAVGCALLLCACASAVLLGVSLSSCSESKPWTLTPDQQRVMREFGPPEGFTVAFVSDLEALTDKGKDPPLLRLETWQYPSLGSEFAFRDGVFLRRIRIDVPKDSLKSPALRPDAFVPAMSADQVTKIVGTKPNTVAAVLPDVFKDLEVQSYLGQVVAGYQDGKLVVLQVFPTKVEGGTK